MRVNESIKGLLDKEYLHDKEKNALTALLVGEQAAVESYELAMRKIRDKELLPILENCRDSHASRLNLLRERMMSHGDKAPESAGWLGTIAGIVEGGAVMLGDRVAMSMLAAGESFGFEQLESHMKDLDTDSFDIVGEDFIPAQKRTLDTMNRLCYWLESEEHEIQTKRELDEDSSSRLRNNPISALQTIEGQKEINSRRKRAQQNHNPLWFGIHDNDYKQ